MYTKQGRLWCNIYHLQGQYHVCLLAFDLRKVEEDILHFFLLVRMLYSNEIYHTISLFWERLWLIWKIYGKYCTWCICLSIPVENYFVITMILDFIPLVSFYTPWKHQKSRGFLVFLGGVERDQRHEIRII